jgi:hypothetical protein
MPIAEVARLPVVTTTPIATPAWPARYRIVQSSQAWYVAAVDERRVVSLTGPALGAELSHTRIGATLA